MSNREAQLSAIIQLGPEAEAEAEAEAGKGRGRSRGRSRDRGRGRSGSQAVLVRKMRPVVGETLKQADNKPYTV